MKLLTKNTYYFLIASCLATLSIGVLLFITIRKQVYKQIDNSLITEKTIIQDQLEQTGIIPDFMPTFGHQIEVKLLDKPLPPVQIIRDTLMTDSASGSILSFRYIYYSAGIHGKSGYSIRIIRSLNEKDLLLADIGFYMFLLLLLLLILSIALNYLISRKIWEPFHSTIEVADKFDIQSDTPFELPETNIDEFHKLNTVFTRMIRKMRGDYLSLKEYNENAAHEIRTPLAVIRSKTELLMQRKEIRKESLNIIKSINEATTRLYKITRGLLLISRIENLYFKEATEISLKKIIEKNIMNYREIMQLKHISVEMEADSPAIVIMNEVLAEILISNLLSNAVRYNIDRGFIKCSIRDGFLSISNSGLPLNTDTELLFKRFNKSSDNSQSTGLGLAIVKKITETYNMGITYTCTGNIHELRLAYSHDGLNKQIPVQS
ncbi:MAG: HAMP domain-containing sensor histidine kinase [Bacteroidota bacterium]|nr:HAMP domain-containing sensor histidine kinase [Bacteroidota bacterium]